jgi:hypothetical protein
MKRPVSITILACVYLAVGIIGFAAHLRELLAGHHDAVAMEVTELVAILCGVFLLWGHNWARWLAFAWIGFHIVLSAFHAIPELVIHAVLGAVFAWILFRPESAWYFRGARIEPT